MRLIPVLFAVLLATPVTPQQMHSSMGHASDAPGNRPVRLRRIGRNSCAAPGRSRNRLGRRQYRQTEGPSGRYGPFDTKGRGHPHSAARRGTVRSAWQPRVLSAINTMVPAHAPFLAGETGWSVASEEMEDGVALIVGGDGEQIQGLGFFGLMTIGVHHQEHHLMIAKGRKPHH